MTEIEKLLAVLDMTLKSQQEEAVAEALVKAGYGGDFFKEENVYAEYVESDDALIDNYYRLHLTLADLAFKLRDELDTESFFDGRAEVYARDGKDPNMPENPDDWTDKQLIAFTVNKEMWWCQRAKPIHFIIASLIAKQLVKDK